MAQFKTKEEYEKWKAARIKAAAEKAAIVEQAAASPPEPVGAGSPRPSENVVSEEKPQPQVTTGKIKKKTEMAGAGCLIQFLGIIIFVVSLAIFPIGTVIGIFIMISLFIIGSQKATKYYCDTCGNPVDNKKVKICPVCKITF